jgi:hypothetical protein
MLTPMQKAKRTARRFGRTVWIHLSPTATKAPFTITDSEPSGDIWPCTVVEPDGSYRRRSHRTTEEER